MTPNYFHSGAVPIFQRYAGELRAAISEFGTPQLLFILPAVSSNSVQLKALAESRRWLIRPHIKALKSLALLREVALSIPLAAIACARPHEASLVPGAETLITSLPASSRYLRELPHKRITFTVATLAQFKTLERCLSEAEWPAPIPILLEVDAGLGRTGVRDEAELRAALSHFAHLTRFELRGLSYYAGHTYGSERDNHVEETLNKLSIKMHTGADLFAQIVGRPPTVSFGGTPAIMQLPVTSPVTEIRVGNFFINDAFLHLYHKKPLQACAVWVAATVVERRGATAIVDVGSKYIGAHRAALPALLGRSGDYFGLASDGDGIVRRVNEELAWVEWSSGPAPDVGTLVPILPINGSTAVNLFSEALALRDTGELTLVSVEGRGPWETQL